MDTQAKIKEIVIISGKGGTGKTTISAALAHIVPNKVMADADVDAANLHILLKPQNAVRLPFEGKPVASIDKETCDRCGLCFRLCRFDAIAAKNNDYYVDHMACEGCKLCFSACPQKAIHMEDQVAGYSFTAQTRWGDFAYARLNPGGENSGSLVTTVRKHAREIAESKQIDTILIDGPPGIGCPVIAAITNTHLAVMVVEPTFSGISDLRRVHRLAAHFKVKSGIVINRYDIDLENTRNIEDFAREAQIPVFAKIPYTSCVREQLMKKELPTTNCPEFKEQILVIYDRIKEELEI